MLEFWAEEMEERTRNPRSPQPFLSQPRDESERCRQAEILLLREQYTYVVMSDDTVLEICCDLWADECSWVLSRAVLDRPVGLLHSLIKRAAIQKRDSNPAFPVQMVGSSARGRRFLAFRTKLLAIGAALGLRQAGETCDGYYQPYTSPIPDPATVWSHGT